MSHLIPGNKVRVDGSFAILLYKCAKPRGHWGVLFKLEPGVKIQCVSEDRIQPYVHYCWECQGPVDSSVDKTCPSCHWVKCKCGACEKDECEDDGITVMALPVKRTV